MFFFCCAGSSEQGTQQEVEAFALDASKAPSAEVPVSIAPVLHPKEAAPVAQAAATAEPPAAKAEPAPVAKFFEVELDKTKGGGRFGLELDSNLACSCGVQVLRVTGGTVAKHNESAAEGAKLLAGDFIAAANQATEAAAILKEFSSCEKVKLRVVRPLEVQVQVAKDGKSMGMHLSFQAEGSTLVEIKSLSDGKVKDFHNVSAPPGKQLKEGDWIKAVNGVSGNAGQIVEAIKKDEVLNFTILKFK